MGFKKGEGGRPKGAKNKLTKSARDAFQHAFEKIGGPDRLAAWAEEHEGEFFKIYGRLIPTEIVGDPDHPVGLTIKIVRE